MQDTMLDSTISNSIQLFADKGFKIRVIMRLGNPWFVAPDACDCLALSNVSKALADLDDDDKLKLTKDELDTLTSSEGIKCSVDSRVQSLNLVSESGLYDLIMQSRKPEAKAFKRWVTHEVLPSIRKTGSYSVNQTQQQSMMCLPQDYESALEALLTEVRKNKALQAERDEAIRTKALIGSAREATAMNTASQKSKECEKLREQIGDSKTYKAVTAISWLPDYFDISNRGLYVSIASKLKKLEAEMPPKYAHTNISDSRWGSVKAYHVVVIERLHEMVQSDENLMKKYRKIASV